MYANDRRESYETRQQLRYSNGRRKFHETAPVRRFNDNAWSPRPTPSAGRNRAEAV